MAGTMCYWYLAANQDSAYTLADTGSLCHDGFGIPGPGLHIMELGS